MIYGMIAFFPLHKVLVVLLAGHLLATRFPKSSEVVVSPTIFLGIWTSDSRHIYEKLQFGLLSALYKIQICWKLRYTEASSIDFHNHVSCLVASVLQVWSTSPTYLMETIQEEKHPKAPWKPKTSCFEYRIKNYNIQNHQRPRQSHSGAFKSLIYLRSTLEGASRRAANPICFSASVCLPLPCCQGADLKICSCVHLCALSPTWSEVYLKFSKLESTGMGHSGHSVRAWYSPLRGGGVWPSHWKSSGITKPSTSALVWHVDNPASGQLAVVEFPI